MVAGLVNCTKLEVLSLSNNLSITAIGLRSLAAFFKSEQCCLRELDISGVYFGDDGAIALADGLVGNTSLYKISLSSRSFFSSDAEFMTEVGWSAFSKRLLCDTSSVRNTYLSNHTLERIDNDGNPPCLQDYLRLNRIRQFVREDANIDIVPVIKILTHHTDLEVESLFQWDLKCLPKVVEWFQMVNEDVVENLKEVRGRFEEYEREGRWPARTFPMYARMVLEKSDSLEFDKMKLSSIFKFVRAMPKLVVNSIRGKGKGESRKRKASD